MIIALTQEDTYTQTVVYYINTQINDTVKTAKLFTYTEQMTNDRSNTAGLWYYGRLQQRRYKCVGDCTA